MNPVTIMFHSAGLRDHRWVSSHIADGLACFHRKMQGIHEAGFRTLTFPEAARRVGWPPRREVEVCLTFDDGYLDNWVHVFPLLRQYGHRATIFVTSEFVDPRPLVRKQVSPDAPADSGHAAEGCCAGFLSWQEMREMERSGLVDVQSHALTHTRYPRGPRIVDFWRPGIATEPGGPVWMLWNQAPSRKPFYLTDACDMEKTIPYGTPVYECDKSLAGPRYLPEEPDLVQALVDIVRQRGGERFFNATGWREQLIGAVQQTRRRYGGPRGCHEDEAQYARRVEHELRESKRLIEENLNKEVHTICWPGGGVTERAVDIARKVGYRHFTLPSAWKSAWASGKYASMVPRIGSMPRIKWRGVHDLGEPGKREFILYIRRSAGQSGARILHRCMSCCRYIGWRSRRALTCLATSRRAAE